VSGPGPRGGASSESGSSADASSEGSARPEAAGSPPEAEPKRLLSALDAFDEVIVDAELA